MLVIMSLVIVWLPLICVSREPLVYLEIEPSTGRPIMWQGQILCGTMMVNTVSWHCTPDNVIVLMHCRVNKIQDGDTLLYRWQVSTCHRNSSQQQQPV